MNSPDRKDSSNLHFVSPEVGLVYRPRRDSSLTWTELSRTLQNTHFQRVGAGFLLTVTILGISALDDASRIPDRALTIQRGDIPKNTAPSNVVDPEQQAKEDAIRREYLKIPEPPLNSGEYLKITEALLSEHGLNMMDFSFRESMAQLGYTVGPLETFGTEARKVKAGEVGHLRRRYPTTDKEWPGNEAGKRIDKGEIFPVYATISVLDHSGLTAVFGLTDAWRITQIPELQLVQSPNVVRGKQYEPSWVRLAQIDRSGRIESFLDPEENVDRLLSSKASMVRAEQRYLKDGSIDYGNGVIGPSLADQARFK